MAAIREGSFVGPYVVESILPEGRGGFALVVVARKVMGDAARERVALKIAKVRSSARDKYSDEDMMQFSEASLRNEVEMLARLRHPSIPRIFPIPTDDRRVTYRARAATVDDKPWYFAMEYLAGGSVETLIEEWKRLDVAVAVEIAQQCCMALEYVHTKGMAHMDIKTSNILLRQPLDVKRESAPQAVLVDWGAAQKSHRQAAVDQGVLVYMPPERVRIIYAGAPPETMVDLSAVDVYSMGVALYRMLTGRVPFVGDEQHVKTAILSEPPTKPSAYNRDLRRFPDLDTLIGEMLSKDPNQRPTAAEVVERLDLLVPPPRFAPGLSGGASGGPKVSANQKWKGVAMALLAATVVEFGALAWFALREPWPVPPTPTSTATPTKVHPTWTGSAAPTVIVSPTPTTTQTPRATVTSRPSNTPTLTHTPLPTSTATPAP